MHPQSLITWACAGYRRAAEKALLEGEKHARENHRSLLSHHVVTLITCMFMQFGGTTLTGIFLGQVSTRCLYFISSPQAPLKGGGWQRSLPLPVYLEFTIVACLCVF